MILDKSLKNLNKNQNQRNQHLKFKEMMNRLIDKKHKID